MNENILAVSLLSANMASLGEEAKSAIDAGCQWVHLDIMDNHFVSNLTFGPRVCESLREYGITAPIDVHLMTHNVLDLATRFKDAGADYVSFHPEVVEDVSKTIDKLKKLNIKIGLALNPETSIEILNPVIHKLDLVILMGVTPGFGGQSFIPETLKKIHHVRELINTCGASIRLMVDGGVKEHNISDIMKQGADTFVVGSVIYDNPPYNSTVQKLCDRLK